MSCMLFNACCMYYTCEMNFFLQVTLGHACPARNLVHVPCMLHAYCTHVQHTCLIDIYYVHVTCTCCFCKKLACWLMLRAGQLLPLLHVTCTIHVTCIVDNNNKIKVSHAALLKLNSLLITHNNPLNPLSASTNN